MIQSCGLRLKLNLSSHKFGDILTQIRALPGVVTVNQLGKLKPIGEDLFAVSILVTNLLPGDQFKDNLLFNFLKEVKHIVGVYSLMVVTVDGHNHKPKGKRIIL